MFVKFSKQASRNSRKHPWTPKVSARKHLISTRAPARAQNSWEILQKPCEILVEPLLTIFLKKHLLRFLLTCLEYLQKCLVEIISVKNLGTDYPMHVWRNIMVYCVWWSWWPDGHAVTVCEPLARSCEHTHVPIGFPPKDLTCALSKPPTWGRGERGHYRQNIFISTIKRNSFFWKKGP